MGVVGLVVSVRQTSGFGEFQMVSKLWTPHRELPLSPLVEEVWGLS